MAKAKAFRVIIATDGSDHARAAIATAIHFPWPAETRVRVVAARKTRAEYRQSILLSALDRSADAAAENARRMLSRRWPDVEAVVVDKVPVDAVLGEADRFAADVIVLGWRGHGAIRRLLMGSVSRGVMRSAKCAVLVVRRALRLRRIVVGYDGSAMSKRALAFVGNLMAPAGGRVILVTAVELMPVPSAPGLVPGARAAAREVKRTNARRGRAAMKELRRAAAQLERAGWKTRMMLTSGEPLRDLLGTVASARPQLLVVGARGTSGVRHILLGSVAEGALNRCPVPVLIAR
jgi:nucleotide-binding universal stress UspA family protein